MRGTVVRKALSLLFIWCVWMFAESEAQERYPPNQILESVITLIQGKCAEAEKQGRKLQADEKQVTGRAVKGVADEMCKCMLPEAQKMLSSLSQDELMKPMTKQEFEVLFRSRVVDPCAARQLRSYYGGDCVDRYRKWVADSAHYCQCMLGEMEALSDAEAASLGPAFADYIMLADEAKIKGAQASEPPPLVKRKLEAEAKCKVR